MPRKKKEPQPREPEPEPQVDLTNEEKNRRTPRIGDRPGHLRVQLPTFQEVMFYIAETRKARAEKEAEGRKIAASLGIPYPTLRQQANEVLEREGIGWIIGDDGKCVRVPNNDVDLILKGLEEAGLLEEEGPVLVPVFVDETVNAKPATETPVNATIVNAKPVTLDERIVEERIDTMSVLNAWWRSGRELPAKVTMDDIRRMADVLNPHLVVTDGAPVNAESVNAKPELPVNAEPVNAKSRQRRWQEAREASGRCVLCSAPRDPTSKRYCPDHLFERNTYNRERYRNRTKV